MCLHERIEIILGSQNVQITHQCSIGIRVKIVQIFGIGNGGRMKTFVIAGCASRDFVFADTAYTLELAGLTSTHQTIGCL